jgi:5-methylcytosine-specific restriction endonuclease McrA
LWSSREETGGGGRVPDRQPTKSGAAGIVQLPIQDVVHKVESEIDPIDAPRNPPWGKRQVLLLNATFEPLTALPLKRAIVLMVCGKAELVHEDSGGRMVHSASSMFAAPSVIRLTNFVRVPYRSRVPLTRAGIMYRDHYRCAYCNGRAETIDHVQPRSRGGGHSWQNCVACCAKCNHKKADKLLSEIGWHLLVTPQAPIGPYWRLLAGGKQTDPLWLPYLGEAA